MQTIRRKVKVFLHCLLKLHRRGIVHHSNANGLKLWTTWVCADCAERLPIRTTLTEADRAWARKVLAEHPELRTKE
jgi:hypothetical protein